MRKICQRSLKENSPSPTRTHSGGLGLGHRSHRSGTAHPVSIATGDVVLVMVMSPYDNPLEASRLLTTPTGHRGGTAMWAFLQDRRAAGYKFPRQHSIGPYFVDFGSLSEKLVVELDGGQHAEQTHSRIRGLTFSNPEATRW